MKLRDNRSNLVVRGVYGLLFVVTVIAAILSGIYGFGLLLLAIIIGGTLEFYKMNKFHGYNTHTLLGILSSILLFAINYDHIFLDGARIEILEAIFILMIPAMFVKELFSRSATPIANLGSTLLSLIYITIPVMLLCNVAMLLGGGEWNPYLLLAYIVIIWSNDTFAYIVGITFGKHVLSQRISPKKSWEGLVGGVLASTIIGVILAYFLEQNCLLWGVMAVIASVSGVLGDLVESRFKRSVEMKDSGNIIPGHGGWLDRFDAFLISTPVVYAFLFLLDVIEII